MMRVEVEGRIVVVTEPGGADEEERMSAGMELETIVMLHRSQLAYEVKIVVYNRVGDRGMIWYV